MVDVNRKVHVQRTVVSLLVVVVKW